MRVAILLFQNVLELDAVGPHTIFRTAARYAPEPVDVTTVGRSRAPVVGSGGMVVVPNLAFAASPEFDVLVVPGGPGADAAGRDPPTVAFLQAAAGRARVVASVCTGAMTLGGAGLLRGLVATTWAGRLEDLWLHDPKDVVAARVVRNPGGRYVGGGVTAGIDVALAILHDAFGPEVARATAEHVNYPWWDPSGVHDAA